MEVVRATALLMQTTKQQLLSLLKRAGSVTVEEAAGALSVASMTARQHLVGLERDGLVGTERAGARPRPPPKGEKPSPSRYDILAQILLDEVGALHATEIAGLSADQKRTLIIKRSADRLAERFRVPVGGRSLGERAAAVTEVMNQIGGFAEWLPVDGGFEIRDYNCVFTRLAPQHLSGCEWHIHLLTRLLRWPVRHEVILNGHGACCRYLVSPAGGTLAGA